MVDEPTAGIYYGGDVAAPVFAQVMAGALRTLGISQDARQQALTLTAVPDVKEEM